MAGSDPLVPDLTLTLDLIDDAILVLHEDGRIIHCNHAASVFALPVKANAMSSLHVLPPGEPWVACRQVLREYRARAGSLEREVRDPGTGKFWSLRLSALAYLGVLPRRLVLVIRDISEAVRMRDRLHEREVMAATGALLAGAAHQAKNAIFGLSATLDAFEARV
jgi:nitrogen-specific signal transduction histidine kinase